MKITDSNLKNHRFQFEDHRFRFEEHSDGEIGSSFARWKHVAISRFILQFQIRDLLFFNFEICCSSIVQLLLTAEQEAQQIVNAARTALAIAACRVGVAGSVFC
ncbi:hypothetical protein LXL04_038018 [Taraxacum kok-saghyz]